MNSFIDIVSFFETKKDRTIENLSSIYNDYNTLYNNIKFLISKRIDLSDIVNKTILLKPNWVQHNIRPSDLICLCTNENFILATVEVILEMSPKSILIGDAPLQKCEWDLLLSKNFYQSIDNLSKKYNIEIIIKDFRRVTFYPKSNKLLSDKQEISNYLIFDIGNKSFLDEISSNNKNFRVTQYDSERLAESHRLGIHRYCIRKEILCYDTIITLPKIKTHQKTGLTNSLKILVGINGDKDYLPHHRVGDINSGGDCYKGSHLFRRWAEFLIDKSNKNKGNYKYKIYLIATSLLWKLSFPKPEQNLDAAWYGNDTTWRMVMDLNLIALYGQIDGTISNQPVRKIYTICDGIIGGQGNGPLNPDPLPLGIISISNDSFFMDEIVGLLLCMNLDKIPLLKLAKQINENKEKELHLNNNKIEYADLKFYQINAIMPPGWKNYNKL